MSKIKHSLLNRRYFLSRWVSPTVVAVALPVHAELSAEFLPRPFIYHGTILNRRCDDAAIPATASFTLCNEEIGDITIEKAFVSLSDSPSTTAGVAVLSPVLPATIPAGGCVDFIIENAGTPTFQCGDSLTLVGMHLKENQEGFITFFLLDEVP